MIQISIQGLLRLSLAFLLCAAFCAIAQISGDIEVTVADPTGAAIPGASVSVRNVETGASRALKSDATGAVRFTLLGVGTYEVRVEAQGFNVSSSQAAVRSGGVVGVPVKLEVQSTRQEVIVSEGAAQINTVTAQLQTTTESKNVIDLPLSNNVLTIAGTTPGVIPVTPRNPFLGLGSYNSNGGRGRANNITVDNATASDVSTTGGAGLGTVPVDAIREVNVISNNFSAEFGRNASSQFQILTKNGTNEFHGRVFEFLRNDKLNSRDYFDRTGKASILRNNRWGAVVGGPIKKDRLFWLGTYEEQKIRGAGGTRIATVPTRAQVGGTIDPTSRALLDQLKVPVTDSGTVSNAAPLQTDTRAFSGRIDFNISSRDVLFGRFGIQDVQERTPGLTFIASNLPENGASSTNRPVNATISHTHTFGATTVNNALISFGRSRPGFQPLASFGGPSLGFQDGTDSFGLWPGIPQGRVQNTYQVLDTLTHTRGAHTLKVGYEVNRIQANSYFDSNVRGSFTFPNVAAFAQGRPSLYSQRFGGSVRGNRVWNQFAFIQDDWRINRTLTLNLGMRLEVGGGVTEVNNIISNLNRGKQGALGGAGTGALGTIDVGGAAFSPNYNFGPRLGFAWNPRGGKLSVRGGYGTAYDFIYLNPITNLRFAAPYMYQFSTTDFTGNNTYARMVAGTSDFQIQGRGTVGNFGTTIRNFGSLSPVEQNLRNPQTHQWSLTIERELPYQMLMRASYIGTKTNYLQRSRPINTIRPGLFTPPRTPAEEDAIRTSGLATQLNAALNVGPTSPTNRIDGRFTGVTMVESSANSNFHSMQLYLARRFAQGYSYTVSYTWSKSIDDVSDALGVLATDSANQQNPFDNRNNRAVSAFDVPHRLAITHNYEPQFFKNNKNFLVRQALHGWQLSGIFQIQSGQPYNLFSGVRTGFPAIADPLVLGGAGATRPNLTGTINVPFQPNPGLGARNPNLVPNSGLTQPLLGNFGTLGRNTLRLNRLTLFDWTAAKNFYFKERYQLQFQAQMYNMFNNTSFSRPGASLSGPATFGYYADTDTDTRNMTMVLRFIW